MFIINPRLASSLAACSIVFFFAAHSVSAGEPKTFTRVITGPQDEYVIEVAGTYDPENVEITIENLGDTPVVNPRMTVNGLYDWYDISSMLAEINAGCTTDEEKALAIWEWVQWKRFQRSPNDESSINPVRNMNGYGYGICGHTAAWVKALAVAAGLKARIWEIAGHTISEVYYNDGWHMLDGNVKVFYLARDNRTIASLAELEKDRWLIERTIHPRDPWVRPADPPGRNLEFVRYLITERDNWESDGYDHEALKDYKMSMTLKPGEKLIRWWKPVLSKFEGRDKDALVPQMYANGQLVWEPDLEKTDLLDYAAYERWDNVTSRQRDGQSPAVHVAEPQNQLYNRPSSFSIPILSPYPVVGGHFWCRLVKESESGSAASVSFNTRSWGSGDNLYNFRWGSGVQDIELDLDSRILERAALDGYYLSFALRSNENASPPRQAGVDWFRSVSDLQVSPHSLPALSLGRNVVRYWDSSEGSKKVRITHKWLEKTDNHSPGRVVQAASPSIGAEVKTLEPALKWQPTGDEDAGDQVADYQVMLSLRPDCRWPLSPALYRNVGSKACEWKVPGSFLNPGTTYYWKVRARDSRGAVGGWGEIFSFKTAVKAK
ncbi:MAG TPA: transglutaminase domain-containing protein [archaeon]|nr:transglutaminase domain-containing protein [archaeon]